MEAKIYQLARDHLVESLDYPAEIGQRQYDPSFAIRGLAVDTDKGLLLKLSYIHAIALRTVFRGRRRLTKEEVLAEYGGSGAWVWMGLFGEGAWELGFDCFKSTQSNRIGSFYNNPKPRQGTSHRPTETNTSSLSSICSVSQRPASSPVRTEAAHTQSMVLLCVYCVSISISFLTIPIHLHRRAGRAGEDRPPPRPARRGGGCAQGPRWLLSCLGWWLFGLEQTNSCPGSHTVHTPIFLHKRAPGRQQRARLRQDALGRPGEPEQVHAPGAAPPPDAPALPRCGQEAVPVQQQRLRVCGGRPQVPARVRFLGRRGLVIVWGA